MVIKNKQCDICSNILSKDEIGLSKKLLEESYYTFLCMECLAEYMDVSIDEVKYLVERFKEEGCALFAN